MSDTQETATQKRQRKPKSDQEYAADSLSRLNPKTQDYIRGLSANDLHTFVQNNAAKKPKRITKAELLAQLAEQPAAQPKVKAKAVAKQADEPPAQVAKTRASRAKPKIVKDDA
ncbi:MAG: hypothetical protein LBD75_07075 [Candidatus Peribacteria bacterium]|nr:hypothetical protein [Candidatus Peribacteria bacterium]